MIEYHVDIEGDFTAVIARVQTESQQRVHRAALAARTLWISLLSRGGGGRIYYDRSKVPVRHQASVPGGPAATWTGKYVGSIFVYNEGMHGRYDASAYVGTNLDYALLLEMGGMGIEARPTARIAGEQFAQQYARFWSGFLGGL